MTPNPRLARRARYIFLVAVVLGLAAMALWPKAVHVDSAVAQRGSVRDSFETEGRTRVKDRYVLSAPMAGLVRRVAWEPGDAVRAGQVLLTLDPVAAPALDARSRAQANAQWAAAQAQEQAARADALSVNSARTQARADLERARRLAAQGMVSPQALEQAQTADQRAEQEAQSARFRLATAAHQSEAARAALLAGGPGGNGGPWLIRSPVDGVVLKRYAPSARPVQAGEALLDIGDPNALEVEVDVLSSDAVRLHTGGAVELLRWGGGPALTGTVRRVEPGAFTKVSALGVEEQRVWVVVSITSPREQWARLGEGYRVQARFVLDTRNDALWVPDSALFHRDDGRGWAVFRIAGGRAHLQPVEVGLQGEGRAAIASGLSAGDRVVLHPPRELQDGTRVGTP